MIVMMTGVMIDMMTGVTTTVMIDTTIDVMITVRVVTKVPSVVMTVAMTVAMIDVTVTTISTMTTAATATAASEHPVARIAEAIGCRPAAVSGVAAAIDARAGGTSRTSRDCATTVTAHGRTGSEGRSRGRSIGGRRIEESGTERGKETGGVTRAAMGVGGMGIGGVTTGDVMRM